MHTFPKVSLVHGVPGVNVKLRDLVSGELVADGDALEHRPDRGEALRMAPVRAVSIDSFGVITIIYGRGAALATARFVDVSHGLLRVRWAGPALASELQQFFASAVPPQEEEAGALKANTATELSQALAPIGSRGRTIKLVFGILSLVAVAGALLTINAGVFGGTSFFVAMFVFCFAWYRYGRRSERNALRAASTARDPPNQQGKDAESEE